MWWQYYRLKQNIKQRKQQNLCPRCGMVYYRSAAECPHCSAIDDIELQKLLETRNNGSNGLINTVGYVFIAIMMLLLFLTWL